MQIGLQKLVITMYLSQDETNISIHCMLHGATYGQMLLSKFSRITCFPDGSMFTNNIFLDSSDLDMGQTPSQSEGILVTNVLLALPALVLREHTVMRW